MIIGKYVTLRLMESKDLEMVREWKNSPENYMYFSNRHFISDLKQIEWFKRKASSSDNLYFIIYENKNNTPIGMTLLESIDNRNRNAVWGIYIADLAFRRRFYAVDAVMLILDYAFSYLNMKKVYGNTLSGNDKGRRFHQSIGFTEEAVFKNHVYVDGGYCDLHWIRMFKNDWDSKKKALEEYLSSPEINL